MIKPLKTHLGFVKSLFVETIRALNIYRCHIRAHTVDRSLTGLFFTEKQNRDLQRSVLTLT